MDKLKNIPSLCFPEFNKVNSYKNHFFKDIFLFSTGKNIKQNEASPEFEIPCVRYGELYHMYNEVINEVINKTNLDSSELLFSQGNEILLPSAGEDPLDIGSASAITIKNVAIGRTINILRPLMDNVYSQIYVAYYINHKLKNNIATLAKGVSISNVYNSDLKTLEITLPNIPEQTKIATFLTEVDDKLQALKQKKTLLAQYKKGVSQKIFSQELRFKDDNGNDYPNWEEKKLGDVCEMKNGYAFKSNTYSVNGKYNIVTISNVQNGYLDIKKINKIEDVPNECLKHQILEIDDLLISLTGNVGRVCFVSELNCLLNQRVGKLIPKNISKLFLFQLLRLESFNTQMIADSQGGAQLNLSKPDIERYEIYLPTMSEQIKIANFLSAIDDKINHCQEQITSTEVWKKGLLQQMFC